MKWLKKIIYDEELRKIDREYRRQALEADDEDMARNLQLLHKYIKIYQVWRRNLITGIVFAIFLICLVFLAGLGVRAMAGVIRDMSANKNTKPLQQTETEQESSSETETETETETDTGKTPLEAENTSIKMTFTGDCILGTDESFNYETGFTYYYDMYGPDYFLQNVLDIFQEDDLTIINFEGTLTNETAREYKQFAFKADPEYVQIIAGKSVEAANLANNHSHDYGEQSFLDTKNILETNNIKTFGYDDVAMLNIKGVDIGIYGIYELDDHLERIPQLESNIEKLKVMGADIIVGIFHWSNELVTFPDDNQLTLGHMAVDLGTDIVVGHHPHVIQGIESYNGKNIVYSLGNFCFGGNVHPTESDTFIYQETFYLNKNREIVSSESNIIPCSVSSNDEYNNYQPTPMTGETAESEMQKIEERSEGL